MSDTITTIKEPCPHAWQFNPRGGYYYCPICDERRPPRRWLYYDIGVERLPDDPAIDAVRYVARMRIWKRP